MTDKRASRYADAMQMLSMSIRRGTQHFDRDHTMELLEKCICGDTIDKDCPLHGPVMEQRK